ncbi:MAG: hypothetical protein SF339_18745 [Blastocatellia bacterium]|nr:hypothetical protein [Blastocatellia bacterium]
MGAIFLFVAVVSGGAGDAGAQTVTTISVQAQSSLLQLNQETTVEIRFADVKGSRAPLRTSVHLTITLTALEDPALAKRIGDWRSVGNLDGESLALRNNRIVGGRALPNEANVLQGELARGQSSLTIRIRSERAGTLRLSVEGPGMMPGIAVVNVQGPSRIAVAINPSLVRAKRDVRLELTLLDYQGKAVSAINDMPITLTVTTMERLTDAQRTAASTTRSLGDSLLVLAKSPGTARLAGAFPRGRDRVSLRLRIDFTGVVRIFAEGVGLATGSTLISTIAQIAPSPGHEIGPQFAFFRQPAFVFPALWSASGAAGRLRIAKIDSAAQGSGPIGSHEFSVVLDPDSSGRTVPPTVDLEIKIDAVSSGKVRPTIEPSSLFIRANNIVSDRAEISYVCRGDVKLIARADSVGVEPSRGAEFSFAPQRHAAMLKVDSAPDQEVANGLRPITLTVTVWDACGATLSSQAESVDMGDRRVNFDYRSDLRFDGGEPTLAIPAGVAVATKKVFSSHRVTQLPVIATSADANGVEVTGQTSVTFYFPFWEFLAAILGGAIWPALSANWKERMALVGTAKGAVIGAVTFGAALYGAMATSEANLGALSVRLVSLPTDSWLAAAILGFIGCSLISGVTLAARKLLSLKSDDAPADDLPNPPGAA